MNIAIVGYAAEGIVSYEYFVARGHTVTICDQDTAKAVPEGALVQLGNDYLQGLERFDLIVRSAGIPPRVILQQNPGVEAKITTAINEFLAHCPTRNIIGVTGTKGKGTTSTLITKMLEAAGHKVHLGGNIGVSPLTFMDQVQPDDWVVLELSSFQLSDLKHSPHIAVCLMVVPEHLNWHDDMADYTQAKANLFRWQNRDNIAIYFADSDTSKAIAGHGEGRKVPFFAAPGAFVNQDGHITIDDTMICNTSELKLLGQHNWQNACAAVTAAWQATHDTDAIRSVLTTFSGLPNRLEFVRELEGVRYYDDSFGTTPETAIVAIQAFAQPKVVILGGSDKGIPFDALALAVTQHNVRHVIAIGATGPTIANLLRAQGFTAITEGLTTMSDMVAAARTQAQPGDIVLLSTGCASFGLFADYKDRSKQFKQAVQALTA